MLSHWPTSQRWTSYRQPVVADGNGGAHSNPEVPQRAVRRRYTTAYKARILTEAQACKEPGEIGALLRREGLHSSLLSTWRRRRDEGALAGLPPQRRGRKPKQTPAERENEQLRREVRQLREQLRQAELIIGVQKKSPSCWVCR